MPQNNMRSSLGRWIYDDRSACADEDDERAAASREINENDAVTGTPCGELLPRERQQADKMTGLACPFVGRMIQPSSACWMVYPLVPEDVMRRGRKR